MKRSCFISWLKGTRALLDCLDHPDLTRSQRLDHCCQFGTALDIYLTSVWVESTSVGTTSTSLRRICEHIWIFLQVRYQRPKYFWWVFKSYKIPRILKFMFKSYSFFHYCYNTSNICPYANIYIYMLVLQTLLLIIFIFLCNSLPYTCI